MGLLRGEPSPSLHFLTLARAAKSPERKPAHRLDLPQEEFEAVPLIEGDRAPCERVEDDVMAGGRRPLEAVTHQESSQATSLLLRCDGEEVQVPVLPGCGSGNGRIDEAEDVSERLERDALGQVAEPDLRSPLLDLRFSRAHPGGNSAKAGEVVDLAERVVVADERCERGWPEASTICLVRIEIDAERILVERAGDDVSGALDVL
jgi:hypothetical protein